MGDGYREADGEFVRRVLIALAIVALAALVWYARYVFMLLFGALIVAAILRTTAWPMRKWLPVGEKTAVLLAALLLLAILGGSLWLFGAEVAQQVRALTDSLPTAWQTARQRISDTVLGDQVREWLQQQSPDASAILSGVGTTLFSVGNALAGAVLAMIGGVYFAAQAGLYRTGLLKLFPAAKRPIVGQAVDESAHALRLWLIGQLIAMVTVGVLTAAGLMLIGVPSAVALGLLAGLAEFVPLVGAIAAAIPALLVALTVSNEAALLTLALYVALQQLEGNVVMPMIQQRTTSLPPALTLFAILLAGVLFGTIGVILATPLAVVAYVLVKRLYVREALHTPTSVPGEREG
jgi:predicted PurR-regulated permease PerM